MDRASALVELQTLPLEERLEFVFDAWDQIDAAGWQPEMPAELKIEIERRLKAHAADPSRVLTWEQVVASLPRTTQ